MGSSSKKYKDKDSRKRRHEDDHEGEAPKDKRHKHRKHHHKDRKRDKSSKHSFDDKSRGNASDGFSSNNDTIVKLVSNCSGITVGTDKRGLHPKHTKIDRQAIYDHIQKYHPCASHYRREHAPNKLYLPSDISIKMMHNDFVKTNPMISCSYELYRNVVVKEKNISLAHLDHEECEVCEAFKLHSTSHTKENLDLTCDCCKKWDVHIKRAQAARQFYRDDVQKARDSDDLYFSADLQKVIMLPRLEMFKDVIFTQRIIAFNESFVPLGKNSHEKPLAILWHEAIAGRKKKNSSIQILWKLLKIHHNHHQNHIVLVVDLENHHLRMWKAYLLKKLTNEWGEFYHKPAENLIKKAEQEKLRAKLLEAKEKRQINQKLKKTKTLGESDEEDDIVSWVSKNRKIEQEKREADKRAKMLEELDAQFGIGEVVQSEQRERMRQKYTEKDLKGLTVQHDVDTISEEHDVILTLKIKVY
nr:unnamed protein product [Callosobruchus chinensis]